MALILGFLMVLMAGAGIAFLARGWRGVRLDDHPVCRKCGFDLTGRPEGVMRCSECGADLARAHAIRKGNRRRHTGLLSAGIGLTALGMAGITVVGSIQLRRVDINRYKPVWWLERDARFPSTEMVAVTELLRRDHAGELSSVQVDKIVGDGLAAQADLKRAWLPLWGDFIEELHAANKLDETRWKKYLEQAITPPKLRARKQVCQGEDVPFILAHSPLRIGKLPQLVVSVYSRPSGESIIRQTWHGQDVDNPTEGWAQQAVASIDLDPGALSRGGDRQLHVAGEIVLTENVGSMLTVLAKKPFELSDVWSLVAANTETVKTIHDAAATETMRQLLTLNFILQRGANCESAVLTRGTLPYPVAFDVFLRANGREWEMGSVYFAEKGPATFDIAGVADGFAADHVDIVFRSNPAVARRTFNITSIWDGEVTIRNVRVERQLR